MANTNQTPETKQRDIRATADENGDLVLLFANGKRLAIIPEQFSPEIRSQALYHGLKQKLVDAAAISRNPETGRSATVDDKFQAVKAVYDRLLSGLWNEPREGGGGGSLLFKALCRMYADKEPATLREWLDKKTDAEKAALRKNPKIAEHILAIQAESAKTDGIDTDALLGEL